MKIGTCLLTVVGMLAISIYSLGKSQGLPVVVKPPPAFDHDPMLITVVGTSAAPTQLSRTQILYYLLHIGLRNGRHSLIAFPLHEAAVGKTTAIVVQIDAPNYTTDTTKRVYYTVQLSFYRGFENNKDFRHQLSLNNDYKDIGHQTSSAPIRHGSATFSIEFLSEALNGDPYKKIYIVGDVIKNTVSAGETISASTRQQCIETATVFGGTITPDSSQQVSSPWDFSQMKYGRSHKTRYGRIHRYVRKKTKHKTTHQNGMMKKN